MSIQMKTKYFLPGRACITRRVYIPLTLACLSLPLAAQELDKEITIDRDIVPAQRAAARPVVFPSVKPPYVAPVNLRMESAGYPVAISPEIVPFGPASTPGSFAPTPWRGYVDLGYFPAADFGLSAGYTILDKEATRLNVWLQASNRNYEGAESGVNVNDPSDSERQVWEGFKWKNFDISGGVGFLQHFGKHNTLRLSTDIAYSNWSIPDELVVNDQCLISGIDNYNSDNLNNLRWHFNGEFAGRANNNLTYGLGAGVGIFHNKKQSVDQTEHSYYTETLPLPGDETSVTFHGDIRQDINGKAAVGIRAEGTFLHYGSFYTPSNMQYDLSECLSVPSESKTVGQVDFIPTVEYNGGSFYGKAGARLGLSVNSGSSFHIAPDIILGVNPQAYFGAWLKLGGGVQANSLESMFMVSRYADPRLTYELSNVAFTGQLGLRVGPFKGAALTLTADYAAANDWLMPMQLTAANYVYNVFSPSTVRSWKIGARIDWQYRSLVTVALSYEGTLGDKEKQTWLYWRDRARHVIGATVSVSPIKPLSVDLGFAARLERRHCAETVLQVIYINSQDYYDYTAQAKSTSVNLGDQTNLWAGASYRFTPALTVFARFDNILNCRSNMIFNTPGQGFTGLFGLGYKF